MSNPRGYLLDGVDLYSEYGVRVTRVRGAYDTLKRKGDTEYSWPDSDGVEAFTDESDIYFEPRTIKLVCTMITNGKTDFATKFDYLRYVLEAAGTHTLKLPYETGTRTVVYNGGDTVEIPRWAGSKLIATFTLTLTEKTPVRASGPG